MVSTVLRIIDWSMTTPYWVMKNPQLAATSSNSAATARSSFVPSANDNTVVSVTKTSAKSVERIASR